MRGVYWLRPGFDADRGRLAEAVAWAQANDLDPYLIPGTEPIIFNGQERLCELPTMTVTLVFHDEYEPQPSDRDVTTTSQETRVRRTVPLKAPPPPGLFINVAAEIQKAADGDPAMREWVENCLRKQADPSDEAAT